MKKYTAYLERLLSSLTRFTRTERRGIILISIITTVILAGISFRSDPLLKQDRLAEIDRLNDSIRSEYYQKYFSDKSDRISSGHDDQNNLNKRTFTSKQTVYIELNSADSAELRTVKGIGPVISKNIVAYRSKLGGFFRKEQLKEVWGVTDENYEPISKQFFIDTAVIQKIDINFASSNSLRDHPYFTESMVRRITEERKLKGGWNKLRELVNNDILLPDEAEKVAPYVVFGLTE